MKRQITMVVTGFLATTAWAKLSFTGYGSFDLSSAYVLYGARQNKEPCAWTYLELMAADDVWGGPFISLWQNTDLTNRRRDMMRHMNEWDWTLGARTHFTFTKDWSLSLESGHIWYKYHGLHSPAARSTYKTMMEIYGRLELKNPYLIPYLFTSYDWKVTQGAFMNTGVKRDIVLTEKLILTPDLTVGGGDDRYLACLYPPWGMRRVKTGLSYTQASLKLTYWLRDWMGIHAQLAYVVLINKRIRSALHGDPTDTSPQFVWGTVGVDFSF